MTSSREQQSPPGGNHPGISRRNLLAAAGGLSFAACRSGNATPSLILLNGRFWTADPQRPWVEAMAMRNGRITALGASREIRRLAGLRTEIINLGGRLAVPGFNDSHIHFLGGALSALGVDLTGARSVSEVQARVRRFASLHPQTPWITGSGWEYTIFPGAAPRREDLDAVVADRPVFLRAYDGHSAWVNSKALEVAGITAATRLDSFGEIVVDPQTGLPTGFLKESAQQLVRRHIPEPTRDQRLQALRLALRESARLGVTSAQNASGTLEEVHLYRQLLEEGSLTMRLYFALSAPALLNRAQIDEWKAQMRSPHPVMLRLGGVKLMVDGVIESHTAAMLDPYANAAHRRGEPAMSPDELNDRVALLDAARFQIFIHAIGDRGVRMALDAFAHAARENGARDSRHRVEHIEVAHPDDIPRFARLGVVAAMQPIHAEPDTVAVWSEAVGARRLPFAFPWRALEDAGAVVAFGSDWPACIDRNPLRGIHLAVNRTTPDGRPAGGWIPSQRVSLHSALFGYTAHAAFAEFQSRQKGAFREGWLADVAVLSANLFEIPPQEIHQTRVLLTVMNGRVVYRDL